MLLPPSELSIVEAYLSGDIDIDGEIESAMGLADEIGATGRVILKDVAGKTHMTVEIACRSAEQLEQFIKMGVDVGTSQTLDNLVDYARRRLAKAG